MRKIVSLFLTISLVICVLLVLPLNASAVSTETKDGLEVSIFTDKDEYSSDEEIKISIKIKNNNSFRIDDISLETLLPEELALKDGELKINDISIVNGETYIANVVAKLSGSSIPGNNFNEDNPDTGDITNIVLWIVLLATATIAMGVTIIHKVKHKKIKMFSLFLCLFMLFAVYPTVEVHAVGQNNNSMSVEKTINVNKANMVIEAIVKHNMDENKPITEAEKYYRDNSEKIVSIEAVGENNVLSEKEVYLLLEERGFNQHPITYEYDLDGNYVREANVSKNSNIKHPMYQTLYVTDDGNMWSIFVVGKTIVANPAFYNAESDGETQVLIAEAGILTSYDDESNQFYVTIPKISVVELMEVEKISVETIEKLTFEEV